MILCSYVTSAQEQATSYLPAPLLNGTARKWALDAAVTPQEHFPQVSLIEKRFQAGLWPVHGEADHFEQVFVTGPCLDHRDEGECIGIGKHLGLESLQDGVHQQPHSILIMVATADTSHEPTVLNTHKEAATLAVEEGTDVTANMMLQRQVQVFAAPEFELHVARFITQEGAVEEPLLPHNLLVHDGTV